LSNITNLNRDYLIKINVKEATIDVPKMTFWNTDKKTSNMFVQLVINMSTNELISQYVTVQNATDYKITLNVIKPKTKQYKTIEATLLNEEKALFEIDLPDEFTDQVGDYSFEFEVSSKVDSNDESITTSNGIYKVNGSILTNLNEETSSSPDLPILKQLIEQVKSLQGGDLTGYQKKEDETLETTSKEVVGAINELSSQFKDIANEKIDNVTLSNNVLTFFANSKTIKTITLPTSTTGGGTNGKEIELQKSTTHIQWRYVGDTDWNNLVALTDLKGSDGAKGDKGDKGDTGTTPNLQIGTVETLDSGSNATASITGTVENPLLNLGIPKGADGESGTGTGGSSEIWKKVIETTFGEDCYAFTVTKDKDDNGLQIKEGFIFITASQPKDTSSNLSFGIGFKDWESSFNGKATIYSLSLYKNYEFYRVGFYFKVINNFVFTQYLGNNRIGVSAPIYNNFNSSSISNANMTSNFRALLNNLDYIDKITVGLDMSTTGLFSKDSIMEVWAKC